MATEGEYIIVGDILFDIIVQPIIYIIEFGFSLIYDFAQSEGVAIIGVSILVNLLCMPLYRMADEHQQAMREKQKSMERWIAHIRKHFSKDERYMMLSAYYREQGYHPAKALVGSLSLLFQIPFFMAAYTYLSHLDMLQGASFLFLRDLSAPDRLVVFASHGINVLPVVMTLLNLVSTAIYTRGLALRDKVQAYGLAVLFLVLLYKSPSGLVLYWTCNQVFSLVKNIFTKMVPNYQEWTVLLADASVLAILVWLVSHQKIVSVRDAIVMVALVGMAVFFTILALRRPVVRKGAHVRKKVGSQAHNRSRKMTVQFFLGAVLLTLLMGIRIPCGVISSSAGEFVNTHAYVNPLVYMLHALRVWGGLLVLWLGTYFLLSGTSGKQKLAVTMWCLCGVALIDFLAFEPHFGTLTTSLVFDDVVAYQDVQMAASVTVTIAAVLLFVYVWHRFNAAVTPALAILCVATVAITVPDIITIRKETANKFDSASDYDQREYVNEDGSVKPLFSLSRTGKNVVVLFLDRAISGYVPYMLNERPELKDQLDGFTYYPNTISYGRCTNFGSPALYAGYEYTPSALNARSNETLAAKHDEALLVMPTIFNWLEYDTTVINPAYAGTYSETTNLSIFDGLEHVHAHNVQDTYSQIVRDEYKVPTTEDRSKKRQAFFFYPLFVTAPEFLREGIYDGGDYRLTSRANPPTAGFISEWSMLHLLPQLTEVKEAGNTYLNIRNNTTHQPSLLQLPDYEPSMYPEKDDNLSRFTVDGKSMAVDTKPRLMHYHANMSSLIQLGAWFDWMRAQGVYDNTRIIIVSDHGFGLAQFPNQWVDNNLNVEMVNPLFMVKDFDAHGFNTSYDFMTNADTPVIAFREVLNGPVNPYTGAPITDEEKYLHEQYVPTSNLWDTLTNNGNVFDTSDAPWYAVSGDIFELSNWRRVDK